MDNLVRKLVEAKTIGILLSNYQACIEYLLFFSQSVSTVVEKSTVLSIVWIGASNSCNSLVTVPCFAGKDPNVVEPKETQQWKHVNKYGETNIRYASRGLKVRPRSAHQQLPRGYNTHKASNNNLVQEHEHPTSSKPLPPTSSKPLPPYRPRPVSASNKNDYYIVEEPRVLDVTRMPPSRKPVHRQRPPPPEIYDVDDYYVIEQPQKRETMQHHAKKRSNVSDFYVSVPIFNEKLNHSNEEKDEEAVTVSYSNSEAEYNNHFDLYHDEDSMRYKNAYVYDESHTMSDSMSYASSMQDYSMVQRSQRPSDKLKPQPRPLSAQPASLRHPSIEPMKTYSHYSAPLYSSRSHHHPASEISFRTNQSSSGSVYDVEFDPPCILRKMRRRRGILIDSDIDYR